MAGAAVRQIVLATRRQGLRGLVGRTNGGMIVHIGVVVVAMGFAASTAYAHQADFTLHQGATATLQGHRVTYVGASTQTEGDVVIQQARIRIDGGKVYTPKLKKFANASQVVGTPSVHASPVDDVYLSLLTMPDQPNGPITVRVFIEPLVSWIWTGGGLMFIGAFFAAFPGRRRRPTDPVSAPIDEGVDRPEGDAPADVTQPAGVT